MVEKHESEQRDDTKMSLLARDQPTDSELLNQRRHSNPAESFHAKDSLYSDYRPDLGLKFNNQRTRHNLGFSVSRIR